MAVTAGTTCYFEQLRNFLRCWHWFLSYPGGSPFLSGTLEPWDYWFREDIMVPGPSTALVGLLEAGAFFVSRRR